MYDGLPEDYSEQLQDVGQELMNGSLDKIGAVIRLVRLGWAHEEADAAVSEMVEQVETTKKLLRDAARVLDDSPSGQARASARLREAGFSTLDASYMVQQLNQQRHVAVSRVRDVLRNIRLGKVGRDEAVEQLSSRGMDGLLAGTLVDVFTDSATYWSKVWLQLSVILSTGALLTTLAVGVMMSSQLFSWLGMALVLFLSIPVVVTSWSWKNWRFWDNWSSQHQAQRECPRSCSPMVMLSNGKGRGATILTSMEWGLSKDSATELVRRRCELNIKAYAWITGIGLSFLLIALASTVYTVLNEPGSLLTIAVIDGIMAAVGVLLMYRGIKGWRCFTKP